MHMTCNKTFLHLYTMILLCGDLNSNKSSFKIDTMPIVLMPCPSIWLEQSVSPLVATVKTTLFTLEVPRACKIGAGVER